MGSGNPGTMNMLRTSGFKLGLITLILDVLKGAIPSLIGYLLFKQSGEVTALIALYSCGIATIIGHMFPVIFKFKGGKGVACAIGIFLVVNPIWLLVVFVFAFFYLWYFDYGSVASFLVISTMIIIQGFNEITQQSIVIPILLFIIFTLIFVAHRKNIYRLLVGKESKANLQKSIKKQLGKKKKEQRELYKHEKDIVKTDFKAEQQEFKEIKSNYKNNKIEFKNQNVSTQDLNREFRESKTEYKIKKARYKQGVSNIKDTYSKSKKELKHGLKGDEIVKTTLSNLETSKGTEISSKNENE